MTLLVGGDPGDEALPAASEVGGQAARTSTSPEVSFHSADVTPTARWPLVSTRPSASMAAKIAAVVVPCTG